MKLSDTIQAIRKNKNMTQTDMAKRIGKTLRTYQKYESGEITPPFDVLQQIAEVLEVRMHDFLKVVETPSPFFMMLEWLRSTGYDVAVIEEDDWRIVELKNLKTWERYKITDNDLSELEKNLLSYTKFQIQELIERSTTVKRQL